MAYDMDGGGESNGVVFVSQRSHASVKCRIEIGWVTRLPVYTYGSVRPAPRGRR